jgi:hypothetical protein
MELQIFLPPIGADKVELWNRVYCRNKASVLMNPRTASGLAVRHKSSGAGAGVFTI